MSSPKSPSRQKVKFSKFRPAPLGNELIPFGFILSSAKKPEATMSPASARPSSSNRSHGPARPRRPTAVPTMRSKPQILCAPATKQPGTKKPGKPVKVKSCRPRVLSSDNFKIPTTPNPFDPFSKFDGDVPEESVSPCEITPISRENHASPSAPDSNYSRNSQDSDARERRKLKQRRLDKRRQRAPRNQRRLNKKRQLKHVRVTRSKIMLENPTTSKPFGSPYNWKLNLDRRRAARRYRKKKERRVQQAQRQKLADDSRAKRPPREKIPKTSESRT